MLKVISEILVSLTVMVILLSLVFLFAGHWLLFMLGLILTPILFLVLFRIEGKITEQIMEKVLAFSRIENISEDSFDIVNSESGTKYKWSGIKQITLTEEKGLEVVLKLGGGFRIDEIHSNFYKLLQNIPSEKQNNNEITTHINHILETSTTCPICGKIAFYKTECLSCGFEQFTEELLEEYKDEMAYIREEQRYQFATFDPSEKIDFFNREDDGFSLDKNWKPFFTEEEIIQYSKENCW